jgi:hypothetical protein
MQGISDLPDDVEILKQIVIELRARLLSNKLQIVHSTLAHHRRASAHRLAA